MLAKPLAACTYLSSIVSELYDACVKFKNRYFYHIFLLEFDAPIRGFPSKYRHPLWYRKTRMVSLPDGKKIEYMFIRFDMIHERDRQTDGWTEGRTDRQTPHDGYSRAYA